MHRLYLYYCYQLGILPKKQHLCINRPELERIWKDTEKILAEHAFVHDHKFPSLQAIADYRKGLSRQIDALAAQRAEIVKQMCPSTFTYRFKLILKANNLPLDLNVHSLRHTNASLLISQGVDVRTVASLLGHAQASTTLDIYAHAFDKNKRKAQEKLGKAIGL